MSILNAPSFGGVIPSHPEMPSPMKRLTSESESAPGEIHARPGPGVEPEKPKPQEFSEKQRSQQSKRTLKKIASRLKLETPPEDQAELLSRQSEIKTLRKAASVLEQGGNIGDSFNRVKSLVRIKQKTLKKIKGESNVEHLVEKLQNEIKGMEAALETVRGEQKGWRGAKFAVEFGPSVGIPFLGEAMLRVGAMVSGPDTGNPTFQPFVRFVVRGGAVVGAGYSSVIGYKIKGDSFAVGMPYGGITSTDAISGRRAFVSIPGVGLAGISDRGGVGVTGRVPIAGVSPGGRLYFEWPGLRKSTGAVITKLHNVLKPVSEGFKKGLQWVREMLKPDPSLKEIASQVRAQAKIKASANAS